MSSQPEHKLELENQFILRVPEKQAEALRQAIKSGGALSKRLAIKFENDIRHGLVQFDNWTMPARLFDLPTIIESYKTLDRKNFYKTADICQILICKEDPDNGETVNKCTNEEEKKSIYDDLFTSVGGVGKREFLYPHGITPPLKNVRKRRFRKTLRKKYVDFSEIEKEVKRLFKFDCEAIDTRYEIVEENKLDKIQPTTFNVDNAPSPMSGGPMGLQSAENSQNINVHELFGEECSSSDDSDDDDEDDDDDKDDDMEMDLDNENEEDNMDDEEIEDLEPEPPVPAADIAAEIAAASDLISQNDDDTEEKRQDLVRQLTKVRERIKDQKSEMDGLDNQALRMRLQPLLDSLLEQEREYLKALEDISPNM